MPVVAAAWSRALLLATGSPAGDERGAVVLPAPLLRDPPPFFTDGAVYGVIRDPATGVERVVVLTYSLDASGRND